MEHLVIVEYPSTSHIHLNRPNALNSLTSPIISSIRNVIKNTSKSIVLTGEGRAFCAGGDVVALALGKSSCFEFFQNEFNLFYEISCLPQSTLSVLDGITLGGGVGLAMACSQRVITEKTMWGMPETAIGFVPDVGASFFLNKLCSKELGLYLALTGNKLIGSDCYFAGVSDLFIEGLSKNCREQILQNGVSQALPHCKIPDSEKSRILRDLPMISQCFHEDFNVETIFARLQTIASPWSLGILGGLCDMCPLSLKLAKESLKRGTNLTYLEALEMEFNVTVKVTEEIPHNFVTSIKHKLVEKKKNRPEWIPANLCEVSDAQVASYYENHRFKLLNPSL